MTMYTLVKKLPLPSDIQTIILEYLIRHKVEWSKFWLSLSIKHLRILREDRRTFRCVDTKAELRRLIYSINANIGTESFAAYSAKCDMIEEYCLLFDIEYKPPGEFEF